MVLNLRFAHLLTTNSTSSRKWDFFFFKPEISSWRPIKRQNHITKPLLEVPRQYWTHHFHWEWGRPCSSYAILRSTTWAPGKLARPQPLPWKVLGMSISTKWSLFIRAKRFINRFYLVLRNIKIPFQIFLAKWSKHSQVGSRMISVIVKKASALM